jgi:hypothetical protein
MKTLFFLLFFPITLSIHFLNENEKILRYLKQIDNCLTYSEDEKTCVECKDNYQLDSNGKSCRHYCKDMDYCNECIITGNKLICIECIHPYKLKDGYCILKAKVFTWVIFVYLFIIVVAIVLILILIKPKLDNNEP